MGPVVLGIDSSHCHHCAPNSPQLEPQVCRSTTGGAAWAETASGPAVWISSPDRTAMLAARVRFRDRFMIGLLVNSLESSIHASVAGVF